MFGFWAASQTTGGGVTRTVTVTPNNLYGNRNGGGTVQTQAYASANAVNMISPITYAWTFVSGDNTVTPSTPSQILTRFSAFVGLASTKTAVYRCVATDSVGSVNSNTVTIELESLQTEGDGPVIVQ